MSSEHNHHEDEGPIDWARIHFVPAIFAVMAAERGKGIIVDTRRPEHYEHGAYTGALNLRGEDDLLTLPRDKDIFLYCT